MVFNIFDPTENRGVLTKEQFVTCIQGIELKVTAEDISELFNYIDDKAENKIKELSEKTARSFGLKKAPAPLPPVLRK